MKRQSKSSANLATIQSEEDIFREKASSYLVCFINECPLRSHCLRYEVGQYASSLPMAQQSVNPRHPKMGTKDCPMFREHQRVLMKKGFTRFYYDMPGRVEHAIRGYLIAAFGRKIYFEMRKGERLISPEQQRVIANACRECGWTGDLVYDGEQEEYDW